MGVTLNADPREVGLCPQRLARIEPWMDRLVADGRLAGLSVSVQRRGKTVFARACWAGRHGAWHPVHPRYGDAHLFDDEAAHLCGGDAAYERGLFQLDDPVSRFLPEFAEMRVAVGGNRAKIETEPARRPITIRDLLTHTAGLTYGFMDATLVDAVYREKGIDFWRARARSPR